MYDIQIGVFWSLWQRSWQQVHSQLLLALNALTAGPVDEANRRQLPIAKHGNLAVITLAGPMLKNAGFLARWGFAGTKETQRSIEAAVADDDVEKIILNIDSPGGSVDGLAELVDVMAAARKQKKIIAQVSGMCASAAYMVASQANKIFAGRMDLIGSIGTRMMLYDFSKMFEEAGIKPIPIDTGVHKSAGAMGTEVTDEQIAEFQRIVDTFFKDFIASVAKGRRMSKKEVRAIADGRIFFAEESISLGLIDGLQTFDDTFNQNFRAPKPARRLRNEVRMREQSLS